jgi:hypothetical protein
MTRGTGRLMPPINFTGRSMRSRRRLCPAPLDHRISERSLIACDHCPGSCPPFPVSDLGQASASSAARASPGCPRVAARRGNIKARIDTPGSNINARIHVPFPGRATTSIRALIPDFQHQCANPLGWGQRRGGIGARIHGRRQARPGRSAAPRPAAGPGHSRDHIKSEPGFRSPPAAADDRRQAQPDR